MVRFVSVISFFIFASFHPVGESILAHLLRYDAREIVTMSAHVVSRICTNPSTSLRTGSQLVQYPGYIACRNEMGGIIVAGKAT